MNLMRTFKNKGIGLLELMLSLAIIAILLIMATRYYQSASSSQKVSQAVDMFAALKSAAQNYHNSQGQTGDYASKVGQLVVAGYLPASYLDGGPSAPTSASPSAVSSPWGTAIGVSGANGQATITMAIPDAQPCTQVQNKLKATVSTAAGETVGGACPGTISVTYAINQ